MLKIWGSDQFSQRQEGVVGGRGARAEVRALRCRHAVRRHQDARVPGDEPELAGADDRGRRLRAVGVAHHRALPLREARHGRAVPGGPEGARRRRALDGLGLHLPERDAPGVLGPDPHPAGEARPEGDRGRARAERAAGRDPRPASEEEQLCDRRRLHHGRHPASAARCSATCGCRSSGRRCRTCEAWFERLRERPAFRKKVDIPLS